MAPRIPRWLRSRSSFPLPPNPSMRGGPPHAHSERIIVSLKTIIPERWVTGSRFGMAEDIFLAWVEAGRPQDPQTFRKGYEAAPKPATSPAAVVDELYLAHRII